MKAPRINCEVVVDNYKAMRQIKNIKNKLIELNNLIEQINDTEIVINVSVNQTDKRWYQFWK